MVMCFFVKVKSKNTILFMPFLDLQQIENTCI